MPNIGPLELIIVLVIVLVIFGPKRLPALARQAGAGLRELKRSVADKDEEREHLEASASTSPLSPAESEHTETTTR